MTQLDVRSRKDWREWLSENHDAYVDGIWLVFYKKGTGKPTLSYEEAVEEALCFGWIDSIIKKIDEESYVRKITPRKNDSKWSLTNKKRATRLINNGQMTEFGKMKINIAKESGRWDSAEGTPTIDLEMYELFASKLNRNQKAREFFDQLAPSYQKQFFGWINSAKQTLTIERRVKESISLLAHGQKLGLK